MPLNPNIILSGQPMEAPPDPIAQYGKMVQLADLIKQSQMRQQMAPLQMQEAQDIARVRQLQEKQMEQQQALAESDTAAFHAAVAEAGDKADIDALTKTKSWRLLSPQTRMKMESELYQHSAEAMKLDEQKIKLGQAHDEEFLRVMGGVKTQQDLVNGVNRLVHGGHLPAEEGADMVRAGYSDENMRRWNTRGMTSSMIRAQAFKEQELIKETAAARKATAEAGLAEKSLALASGAKPEDFDKIIDSIAKGPDNASLNARLKDQVRFALKQPDGVKEANAIIKQAAAEVRQLEVATNPKVMQGKIVLARESTAAREKAKTAAGGLIPSAGDQLENPNPTVDDVPSTIRPMVENALKYQSALPPQSRLNPSAQAIRWWTMKLDPNYSEELYPARKAAVTSMSSGKMGQQLTSMNVVLGHVGRLIEAGTALKNGDLKALNGIANELGVQTGSSAPVVYRTIVHRIGPELTQAYVGSGGEASERKEVGGDFDVNGSPDQIVDAAKVTAKLLSSKMGGTLFQFKRAAHFAPDDPRGKEMVKQFFTPEAIDTMDSLFPGWERGVEPGGKADKGGAVGGSTAAPKFSKSKYLAAHPGADMKAVEAKAIAKGYEVIE